MPNPDCVISAALQVDYNDTFRLLLVTRNTSPYLPPDVAPLLAVTNFSITRSGLEGV